MKDFERFWAIYPKKLSKLDAIKAWGQMKKEHNFDTDKAIAVIGIQSKTKGWTKEGGQYIPHAGSWLRAGGWENVVETVKETVAVSRICRTEGCNNIWTSNYLCAGCLKKSRGY